MNGSLSLTPQRAATAKSGASAGELIAWAAERLTAAGAETAHLDAEVLLAHVLRVNRAALHARPERLVPAAAARAFEDAIGRRQQREPLAYIVGHKEFWSLDFEVTQDVLVPRPETEGVVEIATGLLRALEVARPTVCDVGTGSGCIAVAIAKEVSDAAVIATDVSLAALEIAGRNARHHGVEARVEVISSDLFSGLNDRRFDLVVANPPYVEQGAIASLAPEVRREPAVALNGGADGLQTIRRLIPAAAEHLSAAGWLVMEIGATQGSAVEELARAAGLTDIRVDNDDAGLPRILVARVALPGGLRE
jgi:release factor glutamine methyltransferase